MKKILFIHHAGNFSGAARSLSYLVDSLDRSQFDPEILVIQKGTATDFFRQMGVKVMVNDKLYPFNGTTVSGMSFKRFVKNWMGFFLTLSRFPKVLKAARPDIIHLNTSCLFTFALVAKKFNKNIKVISHVREPLLDSFHGKTLRYFNEKYTDHLVAISHYDASKFKAFEKIKVVYNFVNTEQYKPKPLADGHVRDELGIAEDAVVFLYLSRVSPTNGTLELAKAAAGLAASHPHFAFIIAGFDAKANSSYHQKIKSASQSVSNIYLVEMTLAVTGLIAASDVVVSPFTTPHFSRSVIEGAAMGKPAIVSNVGSQNELVKNEHTGLIYDPADANALKEAIIKLGKDQGLREKMGQEARNLALEKFSSAKNIRETTILYE